MYNSIMLEIDRAINNRGFDVASVPKRYLQLAREINFRGGSQVLGETTLTRLKDWSNLDGAANELGADWYKIMDNIGDEKLRLYFTTCLSYSASSWNRNVDKVHPLKVADVRDWDVLAVESANPGLGLTRIIVLTVALMDTQMESQDRVVNTNLIQISRMPGKRILTDFLRQMYGQIPPADSWVVFDKRAGTFVRCNRSVNG